MDNTLLNFKEIESTLNDYRENHPECDDATIQFQYNELGDIVIMTIREKGNEIRLILDKQ